MRAVWNGAVLADSESTITVEGNQYFPPESLNREHFAPSSRTSVCHWKGRATYFDLAVDGRTLPDAAWTYADPSRAAEGIKDYVAFYGQVEITDQDGGRS